jgi:hypothetical protein
LAIRRIQRRDGTSSEVEPGASRIIILALFVCSTQKVAVIAFFLAEIGDKTQVAAIMLAARFDNLVAVALGTTVGMLIADVPASCLPTEWAIVSRSKRFGSSPLACLAPSASGLCSPAEARVQIVDASLEVMRS